MVGMKFQKARLKWSKYCLSLGILAVMGAGAAVAPQSASAQTGSAKNTIVLIGDGMGWEFARTAAIYQQMFPDRVNPTGATGNTLSNFYTSGKGQGLNLQNLTNYAISTTYGTTIAPGNGTFSTGNSALDNSNQLTGASPVRPGFTFNPTFNAGTTATGGAANSSANAVGNLVGYDPVRGGALPWENGTDREYIKFSYPDSANTATTLYTGVKSYGSHA
jgi:alkaline phosphatase